MNKIKEYKRYKDDPFWMKSKYDGVSGEQRLLCKEDFVKVVLSLRRVMKYFIILKEK